MADSKAVYWLAASTGDVPGDAEWLAGRERRTLECMRFTKRRADWRLGRWTAKRAACALSALSGRQLAPAEVEVVASASGAPELWWRGTPMDVGLSISHCGGVGFAVVWAGDNVVGCDVESVEARSDRFIADFFTSAEASRVSRECADQRPLLTNLIWSAKESALKAVRTGLDSDTRDVEVTVPAGDLKNARDWKAFHARWIETGQRFEGWWRCAGETVYTVVCRPGCGRPVRLE